MFLSDGFLIDIFSSSSSSSKTIEDLLCKLWISFFHSYLVSLFKRKPLSLSEANKTYLIFENYSLLKFELIIILSKKSGWISTKSLFFLKKFLSWLLTFSNNSYHASLLTVPNIPQRKDQSSKSFSFVEWKYWSISSIFSYNSRWD